MTIAKRNDILRKLSANKRLTHEERVAVVESLEWIESWYGKVRSFMDSRTVREGSLGGSLMRIVEIAVHALGDGYAKDEDVEMYDCLVKSMKAGRKRTKGAK